MKRFTIILAIWAVISWNLSACTQRGWEVPKIEKPLPAPVPDPENNGSDPDDEDNDTPTEPPIVPPTNPPTGSLIADGTTDTYTLIQARGYDYETPDASGTHASNPVSHISQVFDTTLGKYVFRFDIHALTDDDRGLPNVTDRQRNEIKTGPHSPENLLGSVGETHVYMWKFKLPVGMVLTNKFCHIHQLKAFGGNDVDMPMITYTCRQNGSKKYFEVIFNPPHSTGNIYLTPTDNRISLDDFLGEWVEATETVKYGHTGSYAMRVRRIKDNKVLFEVSRSNIDMWRDGATAVRPKYGIYRSVGDNGALRTTLRDEILLFADFTLTEDV